MRGACNIYTLFRLGCKPAFGTCFLSAETRPRRADTNAWNQFLLRLAKLNNVAKTALLNLPNRGVSRVASNPPNLSKPELGCIWLVNGSRLISKKLSFGTCNLSPKRWHKSPFRPVHPTPPCGDGDRREPLHTWLVGLLSLEFGTSILSLVTCLICLEGTGRVPIT